MTDVGQAPHHIIVVDDEAAARDMVAEYLELHGYRVTRCDGGAELRAAVRVDKPDLVICDLNMPEEDGLSVVRFLKETSSTPVIMLTATASAIDRVVGLELGADDYLAKPCELRELLARVRSILRRLRWSNMRGSERRLAAIVSFDLVGFSRLVQANETATLSAVDQIFAQIINPSLVRYRGTMFKMLGDGGLLEFPSVVDAVDWSVRFQRAVLDDPASTMPHGRIRFRLGVAIGDIVVSQGDRFGEGVALAVRMQEAARPGTVTLSDYSHQFVVGKVSTLFIDLGPRQLKNIASPMRLWEWASEALDAPSA